MSAIRSGIDAMARRRSTALRLCLTIAVLAVGLWHSGPGISPTTASGGSFSIAQTWPADAGARPERIRVGADGRATVIDRLPRVLRYLSLGQMTGVLDIPGSGAVDADSGPDGNWYIADGSAVLAFRPDGSRAWRMSLPFGRQSEVVGLVYDPGSATLIALDNGSPAIQHLATDGSLLRRVVLADPDPRLARQAAWTDLDVDGRGRVFVLDRGNRRVAVVAADGIATSTWFLDGPARRLAVRSDGAVFTLGMDGWVRWYTASGLRVGAFDAARWALTADPEPSDLAVDAAGDVYITDRRSGAVTRYTWAAAASPSSVPLPPPTAGCRLYPDTRVEPATLPLGQSARVQLVLRAGCGSAPLSPALDLMLVVDSQVLQPNPRLVLVQTAAQELVRGLDLGISRAGLVNFGDVASLATPLTSSEDRLRLVIENLSAGDRGEARIDLGLAAARLALEGRDRPSAVPVVIVLAEDGGTGDQAAVMRQADALRGAGIVVYVVGLAGQDGLLARVATDARYFIPVTGADQISASVRSIATAVAGAQLLRSVRITSSLPANMRYAPDSAQPPAAFDATTRRLEWDLSGIPLSGLAVSYALEPLEPGPWPVAEAAWGDFVDNAGRPGRLAFPTAAIVVSGEVPPTDLPPTPSPPTSEPTTALPPPPSATPPATRTAVRTATPSPTADPAATTPTTPNAPRRLALLPYLAASIVLVDRPPTPAPCLDREQEPNNIPEEALAIPALCREAVLDGTLPSAVPGGVPGGQPDSDDYYRIEVDRSGGLVAELWDIPPGSNFDLFVYDCQSTPGDCRRLGRSQSDTGRERVETPIAPGRYYIRVWLQTGSPPSDVAYRVAWNLRDPINSATEQGR
jgi:hypothetical protein